jgi:hypothetical protein
MTKGFYAECREIRASPGHCYTACAIRCEPSFITRWLLRFPVGQVDHQSTFRPVAP